MVQNEAKIEEIDDVILVDVARAVSGARSPFQQQLSEVGCSHHAITIEISKARATRAAAEILPDFHWLEAAAPVRTEEIKVAIGSEVDELQIVGSVRSQNLCVPAFPVGNA